MCVDFTAVDINRVAHRLKGIKRNANRQRQVRLREISTEQAVQRGDQKIAVFEDTEQAEVAAERDQQREARLVSQAARRALALRDDLLRIAAARERLLSGAALRGGRLLRAEVFDGATAAVVE